MVPVPGAVVTTMVAGWCVGPAFAVAVVEAVAIIVARPLEMVAVTIVAEPEMPRVMTWRLKPPWPARMVLEPVRPRLGAKVAARRMPMIHKLRAIVQDDAEIERGHHIRVPRGVPVGGYWRWQDGAGAKRSSEKKMPVHGSSPIVFSSMMEPAWRHLNGA